MLSRKVYRVFLSKPKSGCVSTMHFPNGSSRAFEMLMPEMPGFDRYENADDTVRGNCSMIRRQ